MNYQCTCITADGRAVCQRSCEKDPWRKVADALGLALPTWCHPATAIVLDIARLHDIERLWTDACAIARVHCPVSVGRSHIRDGIPALAKRAARLQAERDEAVRLLHMLDNQDARHPDVAAFLDGLDT